jgi:hypothetical protein
MLLLTLFTFTLLLVDIDVDGPLSAEEVVLMELAVELGELALVASWAFAGILGRSSRQVRKRNVGNIR